MDRNLWPCGLLSMRTRSLSARRAWIEICKNRFCPTCQWSLSARRAWIEMFDLPGCFFFFLIVALRKESVDRNFHHNLNLPSSPVALRKESVDRNFDIRNPATTLPRSLSARRAWIEMGNSGTQADPEKSLSARRAWIEMQHWALKNIATASLSARRAWIEIMERESGLRVRRVALRKESVDRNMRWVAARINTIASLSARRAWIEIRTMERSLLYSLRSRSPQGERG